MERKDTRNPKLGQSRRSRSTEEKQLDNYLLIVFIVTLYSLQKDTKFVDRAEQKVATNPELGQIGKVGQLKKKIYNYVFVFTVNLWTGGGCMKW